MHIYTNLYNFGKKCLKNTSFSKYNIANSFELVNFFSTTLACVLIISSKSGYDCSKVEK